MNRKNKIQSILDRHLKFKKRNSETSNSSERFSDGDSEDIKASKDISQLFSAIRSRDVLITGEDKFGKLNERIDFAGKTSIARSVPDKRYITLLKVAAVLIPIAVLASFLLHSLNQRSKPGIQMVASTLKGSKTKLVLEDGTQVWLNGASELRFPSTFKNSDTRTVILKGEAFFDVTRNEKKPFEVYAKGYKVNVLGTSFNVKAYPEDRTIEATLEHGKVDIEKLTDTDKKETKKVISLKPNQTILIYDDVIIDRPKDNSADNIREEAKITDEKLLEEKKTLLIENNDLSPYISWKDNELTFKNEPLKNVVSDLERWYDVTIKLIDEELNDIKFTATFTTETVEQAIYALCVASDIDYEINKNEVVLKTNKNR